MKTLRSAAVILYGLGMVLAAWLMCVSFEVNWHLFEWTFGSLAASFLPQFLLMAVVLMAQGQSAKVRCSLIAVVVVASATLFMSLVSHGFPEIAHRWSIAHVAFVAFSIASIFLAVSREGWKSI